MSKKLEIQRLKDQVFQRTVLVQAKRYELKKIESLDEDRRDEIQSLITKISDLNKEIDIFKNELKSWSVDPDKYCKEIKDEVRKVVEQEYIDDEGEL